MSSTLQSCNSHKSWWDTTPSHTLSFRTRVRSGQPRRPTQQCDFPRACRSRIITRGRHGTPRSPLPSSSALLRGDRPPLAGVRPSSKFPVPLQVISFSSSFHSDRISRSEESRICFRFCCTIAWCSWGRFTFTFGDCLAVIPKCFLDFYYISLVLLLSKIPLLFHFSSFYLFVISANRVLWFDSLLRKKANIGI